MKPSEAPFVAPNAAFSLDIIAKARAASQTAGQSIIEILEEQLGLTPHVFVERLAATFRYRPISLSEMQTLPPDFQCMPYNEASKRCVIALRDDSRLVIVLADPFDNDLIAWTQELAADHTHSYRIAHRVEIQAFLSKQEESLRAIDGMLLPTEGASRRENSEDISLRAIGETDSLVVRLVNSTIHDALKASASDIHLEGTPTGMAVKYRIDGVLTPISSIEGADIVDQTISRVKVMADLDISERRIPQDGRIRVVSNGRDIDVRVSIMPSIFGEDAVLRILDKRHISSQMHTLRLEDLGYVGHTIEQLRRVAAQPYGMLLVTGPTGSGKTTTLYALISEINNGLEKIVTIEDPVEYQLAGVLQIPVNEAKGLTFARGLRSILRHDPDRIMVGEIRDPETAEIAVQAALTGHLVYTTVHANNTFDVIGRMMHMRIDPHSFVYALNAVVAQRLLRVSCVHCKEPCIPSEKFLRDSALPTGFVGSAKFMRSRGCIECRGTGYRGRRAVAELLMLNDRIRQLIVNRSTMDEFRDAARENGTVFLRDAALELVAQGETTLEEANRVTVVA